MPVEAMPFVNGPMDGQTQDIEAFVDKIAIRGDDGWHYIYRRNMGKFELLSRTEDLNTIADMSPEVAMKRLKDFVDDLVRETDMLRHQIAEERAKPKVTPGMWFMVKGQKHTIEGFDEATREIKVSE